MTAPIVPISRNQKITLKEAPLTEVGEVLLGGLPEDKPPMAFPEVPVPLKAGDEVRKSFVNLGRIFNKVVPTTRRALTPKELEALGQEYADIKAITTMLAARSEQIKEAIRTHQDVDAEESGIAFPRDVVRNGNILAAATPRDPQGHYLLAAPKQPVQTEIPGSHFKFSTEFRSGSSTVDLDQLKRDYEDGMLDEDVFKAVTKTVRVVDAEKLRSYVLKTGQVSLLSRVLKKKSDGATFFLRTRKK